jgi:hypothetical protein
MGITRPETLVQEALAPEKMAEAQHTAMGTRTRSPCPALALQNAPQTDAIHEDRARAFQKEKTSCQGRPMKAHALPCLKPLMICTLPRSPYARQHDAMRCCCHAHGPRYCLPLLPHHCCHSATTALPHYFAPPLRAACTLMTPHCCCLAAATFLSSPPILYSNKAKQSNQRTLYLQAPPCQSTETRLEYNQARNLQLSVTATTAPVASITTPVDLAANAIASTAFASPTSIPPTRPHAIIVRHHPSPQGESGTTPLYGGGRDVQHRHTAKKTKPPNPPPVGKAGFEVWVLTKGGLVSVHHCRLYCTVVHAHHVGRYVEP